MSKMATFQPLSRALICPTFSGVEIYVPKLALFCPGTPSLKR